MPFHRYPFVRFEYADGEVDRKGQTYLPVRITNPATGESLVTWGLLDTGADACLFPAELASELGHDLRGEGVKASVTSGIEQTEVPTYRPHSSLICFPPTCAGSSGVPARC